MPLLSAALPYYDYALGLEYLDINCTELRFNQSHWTYADYLASYKISYAADNLPINLISYECVLTNEWITLASNNLPPKLNKFSGIVYNYTKTNEIIRYHNLPHYMHDIIIYIDKVAPTYICSTTIKTSNKLDNLILMLMGIKNMTIDNFKVLAYIHSNTLCIGDITYNESCKYFSRNMEQFFLPPPRDSTATCHYLHHNVYLPLNLSEIGYLHMVGQFCDILVRLKVTHTTMWENLPLSILHHHALNPRNAPGGITGLRPAITPISSRQQL
jgi:hypothetical protein